MKTPIQELYGHLKASKEKDGFGETYCVDWLLENEQAMLEKEYDFIEEVWYDAKDEEYQWHINRKEPLSFEDYIKERQNA